jgi:hypothetical protein
MGVDVMQAINEAVEDANESAQMISQMPGTEPGTGEQKMSPDQMIELAQKWKENPELKRDGADGRADAARHPLQADEP